MMKKLFYLILLIAFASCSKDPEISKAQEDFHLKIFGGSATDGSNAVITDGENLFLTGTINQSNGPDLFVIKTDKYGNEVSWSPKLFGFPGTEIGTDIALDKKQNIVIAGHSQASGSEYTNVFVVKTDANGNEIWSRSYGGPRSEKAFAVNITPSNTIFITGSTESSNYDLKKRQGWILALSENGDSIWSRDYGTNFADDELHDVIEMKDSLLLIGSTQSLFGNFKQDVFLFILKKSTVGIENSITLFKIGEETGVSAVYTPSGEIFVLGYTLVNPQLSNIIVWKLGEDLQIRQEKQLTTSLSEVPSSINYDNGSVVIVGTATNEAGNEDMLTYVLDTNLNINLRSTYGSKGNERGSASVIVGRSVVIGGSIVNETSSRASLFKTPEIIP